MDTGFPIRVAGGLFAIMNPFTNLPVFLSLVDGQSDGDVRRTALTVVLFAAIMCAVVAPGGQAIMSFFGIGLDDFRLAGGLVVLLIGLGMLNGHDSTAHHGPPRAQAAQGQGDGGIAFYPVTFPMLVGPGTISTLPVFSGQAEGAARVTAYWAALGGVLVVLAAVLSAASAVGHLSSQTPRAIMTRLMGVILAAIAVGTITGGLRVLLPGLAGQGRHAGAPPASVRRNASAHILASARTRPM